MPYNNISQELTQAQYDAIVVKFVFALEALDCLGVSAEAAIDGQRKTVVAEQLLERPHSTGEFG